jgi:hypothetical protein
VSLRYHPHKFFATGVDFDEHGVEQNWQQREWEKPNQRSQHTQLWLCTWSQKEFFFLAGNSPVQPLPQVTQNPKI